MGRAKRQEARGDTILCGSRMHKIQEIGSVRRVPPSLHILSKDRVELSGT